MSLPTIIEVENDRFAKETIILHGSISTPMIVGMSEHCQLDNCYPPPITKWCFGSPQNKLMRKGCAFVSKNVWIELVIKFVTYTYCRSSSPVNNKCYLIIGWSIFWLVSLHCLGPKSSKDFSLGPTKCNYKYHSWDLLVGQGVPY